MIVSKRYLFKTAVINDSRLWVFVPEEEVQLVKKTLYIDINGFGFRVHKLN
jgi:hypothetical protein